MLESCSSERANAFSRKGSSVPVCFLFNFHPLFTQACEYLTVVVWWRKIYERFALNFIRKPIRTEGHIDQTNVCVLKKENGSTL